MAKTKTLALVAAYTGIAAAAVGLLYFWRRRSPPPVEVEAEEEEEVQAEEEEEVQADEASSELSEEEESSWISRFVAGNEFLCEWVFDQAAQMLYGLIHAQYILTSRGMVKMSNKFDKGVFGYCPRISCPGQNVLPAGRSDYFRDGSAVLFCPGCQDTFHPGSTLGEIDGSFFGTTFANKMIMQINADNRNEEKQTPPLARENGEAGNGRGSSK